jgi:hypothetical protein
MQETDIPSNVVVLFEVRTSGVEEIHTGLSVEGAACTNANRVIITAMSIAIIVFIVGYFDFGLFRDLIAALLSQSFFLCLETGKLDELDACRANRVRPVSGALGLGNSASDLVQEIGRRYGSIERSDEVRGKRVKSLE